MPLPKSVARFNRSFTNAVTLRFAGRVPGFGIVVHRGRRSGHVYRTPVNVFRGPDGFRFVLTYGRGDWVENVLAEGTALLRTRGRAHGLADPVVVDDPDHEGLPFVVRAIVRLIHADQELRAHAVDWGAARESQLDVRSAG